MSFDEVAAIVARHDSAFEPQSMYRTHGVIVADDFESGRRVSVDPSNGQVLADFNPVTEGGFVSTTMGLMYNLHLCLLSCEEYPGYQAWLAAQVPGTAWAGFEGQEVTWGGLLLGVMGPLLLLWAVTGMGYEFGFVGKAWYQAMPGEASPEVILESAESEKPDIGVAAAVAAAQRVVGTDVEPLSVDLPHADEPTSTYGVWFADGFDPYMHFDYAGDHLVSVDRHDAAKAQVTYGGPAMPMAQELWQDYNFSAHSGMIVNGWWRIIWGVLGLVPCCSPSPPCRPGSGRGRQPAARSPAPGSGHPPRLPGRLGGLVPLLLGLPGRRRPDRRPARADHLVAAVAAGAALVVSVRLHVTWRA